MANYIVTDTDLTTVASTIRSKAGLSTSNKLTWPNGFISNIPTIGLSDTSYNTGSFVLYPGQGVNGGSVRIQQFEYIVPSNYKKITDPIGIRAIVFSPSGFNPSEVVYNVTLKSPYNSNGQIKCPVAIQIGNITNYNIVGEATISIWFMYRAS